MTVTVLLMLVYAKLKGMHLKPLLKAYPLYPVFLFEIFSIFLQIQIFIGNYSFVAWNNIIKTSYMVLYIIPVMYYKLYKPALVGSGFIFAGTLMNKLVIAANGGRMPVYPSLSKLTGYFKEEMFLQNDGLHMLGTANTRLKFLSDYLDVGYSILSVGDLLIRVFVILILYYSIKSLQQNKECDHADVN